MSRQLHDSSSHTATAGATQPRYRRLARTLAGEIRRDYRPGDLLPPEKALAERFGVNRHTVRRALDELVSAGLITRHQGIGSRVVNHRLDYSLSAHSKVTRNLAELGLGMKTDCLWQGLATPPAAIAHRFGRLPGGPLLCVDTLRITGELPLLRLRHWFDDTRLPNWTHRYQGGSTRALLAQHYGLTLTRRHVSIEAVSAERDDYRLLECARGTPLLVVTSDNVDDAGALVEVSIGRARANRIAYHIDFNHEMSFPDSEELS
ncbi:phosphonate metabolism transcriptional regulator PhnF [Kushneria phosphatilytica]|uniref:phosphonate metabolism transcriptional regulator PhnF n=1 Tax=Kushneria phosphatilytica TaxID=657387 RepID=UPI000A047EE6|nr:phosphonate metabolism transcriptional regulator PhnF [Kushneria phosphatilytica]